MSETGDVKRHNETGAVAIRTNQPEQSGNPLIPSQAWLVATVSSGAHFVSSDIVADWEDIYSSG